MRKYYFSLLNNQLIFALTFTLFQGHILVAQVGIGTTTPQAMLDVVASDPANPNAKDGFLMPRVTSLTQEFSLQPLEPWFSIQVLQVSVMET